MQKVECPRWETWQMHWRFTEIFENETAFAVGVICLGLFAVAMVLAILFVK